MVWLMILLAVGIIVGNLMLLKHTAHIKMPSLKDKQQRHQDDSDDDDWRDD
ncbi:DUF2897 family protein [Pseudidiomarina marina]|uniref:DUF2897 family protein n=1 Tax=Pseudidiomarina marina TaxID=502366 RepID=UPI000F86C2B2|nr:DUF2897 family protein [Pseudidiomarina marina]